MTHRTAREEKACAVRATYLAGFVFLLLAALAVRFFDLMVLRHAEANEKAAGQIRRTEVLEAWRGTIRDRRGRPLALTRVVPSVIVDPALVDPSDREALARQLSRDLEVELSKVRDHLARKVRFRWIRRRILDPRIAERVPYLLQHPAVSVVEERVRCYPHGTVGAHFVGFVLADGGGAAGAELAFNSKLKARYGSRVVLRDGTRAGRRISTGPGEGDAPRRDGQDVHLTMDLTIQTFADEALEAACAEWEPEKGVAIVLDPRNGDVLALACRPNYDPREYGKHPDRHTIPAVADAYPIGSTMKPLIIAAALDQGLASVEERIDCENGFWRSGRRGLHDSHPYGILTLPEVIVRSSNIGTAKIARRMGIDGVRKLLAHLNFGRSTGCGLPGEARGSVTPPEDWTVDYTLVSVAMGQEITATPLQFAAAFATLASGGVYRRPRVTLDREEQPLRQVYSREVVEDLMVPILERVVTEGTGKAAAVPGHRVAGKTGTAEIRDKNGATGEYVSSFVGFAPAEAPRFLVYVTLLKPRTNEGTPYGSRCAAPAVAEILDRCLRYAEVPPSRPAASGRPGRRGSRAAEGPAAAPRRSARELDLIQLRLRNRNR